MSSLEKVYTRNERGKRYCPAVVIYTMPIFIVAMVVGFIAMLVNLYQIYYRGAEIALWSYVMFAVCFSWGIASERIFEFKMNCTITFKPEKVLYQYKLNGSVVASNNSTATYQITEISKYTVIGKSLKVYGKILLRAPLKKPKELKKVALPFDNFENSGEILSELEKYKIGDE